MRVISGAFGGRMLKTTSGSGYRPATDRVREALFSMLEHRGVEWENSRVIDVFAGSGSLGIEALSRGAGQVWFLEKNRRACRLITANLKAFGVDRNRYHLVARDAFPFLRSASGSPFDVAFVDPPYGKDMLLPTLDLLLAHSWLAPSGLLVAEFETGMRFEPDVRDGLDVLVDRTYGQTRICIWSRASIA
jgi:16S rRNA (guanine966-N2)-methyltransferase